MKKDISLKSTIWRIANFLNSALLMFTLLITMLACLTSPEQKNQKEKKVEAKVSWEKILESNPVQEGAIELQYKLSFPNKEMERKGIFLHAPRNICSDNQGNFYVSDARQNTIFKFDSQGNFSKKIGGNGQAPGEFLYPNYLAINNEDNLIIYDTGNSRIQIFNSTSNYVRSFKVFKTYSTMAADNSKKLYLGILSSGLRDPLIEVLNENGQMINSFGTKISFKENTFAHNEINLSINENEDIFVAWTCFPYVKKFSKNGKLLAEYKINYKLIQELSKPNYSAKKENNKIRMMPVINTIRAKGNKFYLFLFYPRIEILELDFKGEITNIYWKESSRFDYFALDFLIKEKKNEKLFYILEGYPQQQVKVFSVKK